MPAARTTPPVFAFGYSVEAMGERVTRDREFFDEQNIKRIIDVSDERVRALLPELWLRRSATDDEIVRVPLPNPPPESPRRRHA